MPLRCSLGAAASWRGARAGELAGRGHPAARSPWNPGQGTRAGAGAQGSLTAAALGGWAAPPCPSAARLPSGRTSFLTQGHASPSLLQAAWGGGVPSTKPCSRPLCPRCGVPGLPSSFPPALPLLLPQRVVQKCSLDALRAGARGGLGGREAASEPLIPHQPLRPGLGPSPGRLSPVTGQRVSRASPHPPSPPHAPPASSGRGRSP